MKRLLRLALVGLLIPVIFSTPAVADGDIIKVMTRNQYLGADLTPLIGVATPEEFVIAANAVFAQIAANNFLLRVQRLATEVAITRPHVIGLQEVYDFQLNGENPGPPFVNHLDATLAALAARGQSYVVAATVINLNLLDIPVPLDTNGDGIPDEDGLVSMIDRDVILVRQDVAFTTLSGDATTGGLCGVEVTNPIPGFPVVPAIPSPLTSTVSEDGCNYTALVQIPGSILPTITLERGLAGVDITVVGKNYRVVNTHLEIREVPPGNTGSRIYQYLQAEELVETLRETTPADLPLILLGDFNSCDEDVMVSIGPFDIFPPYQVITDMVITGPNFTDVWDSNPLKLFDPDGFTCCQLDDLSNITSELDERIDIVFVSDTSFLPLAYVTGRVPIFPLWFPPNWASDHGGVFAKLIFR